MYAILAGAIILAHLLFIAFVVAGGLLVVRWPRLAWVHIPAVVWGVVVEMTGWICPLTPLENHLRRLSGSSSYSGGFIEQYLIPVIYPANITASTQFILGGLVIAINLVIYAIIIRKQRALPKDIHR
ncbi:MAG: hypothetical protein FD159_2006 [Syntrophaceae bacterium]|nr:MAG: hypothetical protein FD159_2006 [Syntrophaceae bacterium]